ELQLVLYFAGRAVDPNRLTVQFRSSRRLVAGMNLTPDAGASIGVDSGDKHRDDYFGVRTHPSRSRSIGISGRSAGGIGYSASRFTRTHLISWPSRGVITPSQVRIW